MTPEIDRQVQKSILDQLGDPQHTILDEPENTIPQEARLTTLCHILLRKAFDWKYEIVTRFIPPYCTTVTFYKRDIGFVTVSRLNASFDKDIADIGGGHWVTQAACDTIKDAFIDIKVNRSRHRESHESAMDEALKNSKIPEKVEKGRILHSFRRRAKRAFRLSFLLTY